MIAVPEAFKAYRQFILWREEPGINGKIEKVPVNPFTLYTHSPHDPAVWVDYDTAAATAEFNGLGVAFVFTEADPFFFFDIDHAWDGAAWSQLANQFCELFNGCAIEVSHSGTGLHLFGCGQYPPHACKNVLLDLEFYTEKRFVALTGTNLSGDAAFTPPVNHISWLIDNYFPPNMIQDTPADWTSGPVPEWNGPVDDMQLIEKMLKSKSAAALLGGRASIYDLWVADVEVLSRMYPSVSGKHPYDQSSADQALCSHLAFWTGKDCERMDRIFRMSALVREKWLERDDNYRKPTILKAVGNCQDVYGNRKQPDLTPVLTAGAGVPVAGAKNGFQFQSINQQVETFKGCVYIRDLHRILTPDGALLKSEQFRAMYGGYVYALDADNTKTTRNAWEVFTESQAINFPKAFCACFRPESAPGTIIEEEGGTMVNTYTPAVTARKQGDPTRFLTHLAKLLPDERDRLILLSYMAACVQHVGVKFQWCPLIQGCEGNGKTLLTMVLANAVGWKYTHFPNANDLTNKFNSWILGKLLIGVEEIYVNDRKDAIEALKSLITNPRIEIHAKGQNQVVGDNRANFFMCTNHKDAIRKTKNDRRYAVFYTTQQSPADMRRTGMNGDYFPDLYNWLRSEGYAIVTDFLHTFQIPDEFNPAKRCHRAPLTTSTKEALMLSLGGLEQEIIEAIEEGRYGFANGWISSLEFTRMLKERRDEKRIPPNKRKQILKELGYMPHPHLRGGRVDNDIIKEAGKPVLYLLPDNPALILRKSGEITLAYQTAQGE